MQKLGLFGVRFGGSVYAIQGEHGIANAGIGEKGFAQKMLERERERDSPSYLKAVVGGWCGVLTFEMRGGIAP